MKNVSMCSLLKINNFTIMIDQNQKENV